MPSPAKQSPPFSVEDVVAAIRKAGFEVTLASIQATVVPDAAIADRFNVAIIEDHTVPRHELERIGHDASDEAEAVELLEDYLASIVADQAANDDGENIPWGRVKKELGLG